MKITRTQLAQLIGESVRAQGGDAKTQKIIVEKVIKNLQEDADNKRWQEFKDSEDGKKYHAWLDKSSKKFGKKDKE